MEYYKKLFFIKRKHRYDLNEINFHIENNDNAVEYDNIPSKGFKLIMDGFLDPVTGYVFHPANAVYFKEMLIKRNYLLNGVCIKPIIFEYLTNGYFNAHIYDDVKDDLEEVSVSNKISLSESTPGSILRNINDESYYIYLGMVGQFYVSRSGKMSLKKKHLVLKTTYFKDTESDTVFNIQHFSYVSFTKDKEKKYIVVRNTDVENLKIQCYYFGREVIPLGSYIKNNAFQVYEFQHDYPSLLLSKTVKKLFSKDDISLTRNKVELNYEYIGESSLELVYTLDYQGSDPNSNSFFNTTLKTRIDSTDKNVHVDFEKYNYAAEIDGTMFLLSPRPLYEIDCYSSFYDNGINLFEKDFNTYLNFYKIDSLFGDQPLNDTRYFRFRRNRPSLSLDRDVKLYKIEYILNKKKKYNLFDKSFERYNNVEKLVVSNNDIFAHLKTNKELSITILGKGAFDDVSFV